MTHHSRITVALICFIALAIVAIGATEAAFHRKATPKTSINNTTTKKSDLTWKTYTAQYSKLTFQVPTTWKVQEYKGQPVYPPAPPAYMINSPDRQTQIQIYDGQAMSPSQSAISGTILGNEPITLFGQQDYWAYQLTTIHDAEYGDLNGQTTVNAFIMASPNSSTPPPLSPDQTTSLPGRQAYLDISVQNLKAKTTIAQLKALPDFPTAQKIVESLKLQ
jgi:hypothetical protein